MNTKQIVHRVLSGSILRTFSLASTVLISFFMMPFLIHSLGGEQYGIWVVVGSIIGFYGFFDLGLATAVGRYLANAVGKQDYNEVNRVVNTAFVLFGVLGAFIIVLSCIGAAISVSMQNNTHAELFAILFIIMGVNIGLQFPLRTFSGILTSQMRFDLLVYVELFKLFTRSGLIVLFIIQGYTVIALAVIALLTEIAGNLIEFRLVRRNARFIRFSRQFFHTPIIKQLALYSWAAFLTNISEMARSKIIPILVTGYLGLAYVVLYSIALRIIEYFDLLMRNCVGFMMPVLSRFEGENNNALVQKTFQYLTIFSITLTVFVGASIYFYGETFIVLWMSEQYTESYHILLLLLIPTMLIVMQTPSKDLLFALSKHNAYAILSLCEVIGILIATHIFANNTDLNSLAYAAAGGVVSFELIKPFYVAKALNEKVIKVYGLYIKVILKSLAILTLYDIAVLQHCLIHSYVDIIILGTLQAAIFAIACYFLILPKPLQTLIRTTIIMPVLRRVQICH